ncbi:hypothetical protein KZ810_02370 [Sphingomonas sp. RHCKR47]|uniref:hypothetical protein n=1 Tax=Sphingomonas citricola TaxID=2862498 RepID=UPI001CA55074|nr:hypothetical protein [Sphingomonas citricola]MBW6522331.1 hypothetical protein [Sphingomonas citricola]
MPWSLAFMVVMIVMITAIAKTARHRNHHMLGSQQPAPHEVIHAQEEIRALKERVQVLERVITDNHNSLDLDREIARLRDR